MPASCCAFPLRKRGGTARAILHPVALAVGASELAQPLRIDPGADLPIDETVDIARLQAAVTLTQAGLEFRFPCKLQAHDAAGDVGRFQQNEIRRSRAWLIASIGELRPARGAAVWRERKLDIHARRRVGPSARGIDGIAPDTAAGCNIAALRCTCRGRVRRSHCEQWIKEGKGAIKWTRLSCRSFAANEVAIPRNLFGDILRLIAELRPPSILSA
jgi:hypothetical protein